MRRFPIRQQHDTYDCGPTCLKMVAEFYGRKVALADLRELCNIAKDGSSMKGMSEAATALGLRNMVVQIPFDQLRDEIVLPAIVHWGSDHFVVVYQVSGKKIRVADPEKGLVDYTYPEFCNHWLGKKDSGYVLVLDTTPDFFTINQEAPNPENLGIKDFILRHLSPHRRLLIQLAIGMLVGLVLQLIFPVITQGLVDYGIGGRDMGVVYLFLIAQVVVSFSQTAERMLRSWIFLHVGARISISLVTQFLSKMMRLPLGFFETRTPGDLLQRIEDHERVERFLTSSSLSVLFSLLSVFVFAIILGFYQWSLLVVFAIFTSLSIGWILLFLKRRRRLDQEEFDLQSQEQDCLVEMIHGVSAIKVHGVGQAKRWRWEKIAAKSFKIDVKQLTLEQTQLIGTFFLERMGLILISFLSARAVIQGDMTFGMMLAAQYIVGQMSGPIDELLDFVYQAQDARISLDRMRQIYDEEDESPDQQLNDQQIELTDRTIHLRDVAFHYPGTDNSPVIDQITVDLTEGEMTAIVGASGSGKTTLLKLLLQLYTPTHGNILAGDVNFKELDRDQWRSKCGVVMQDGFIFSETIEQNIVCGAPTVDQHRLDTALQISNLSKLIKTLPEGLNTKIGSEGREMSGGQVQRILIARAVYQNPDYVFFDEATSALDAASEREITRFLTRFFKGRTVLIIAHRLSTVQNADKILVMKDGLIVEQGPHEHLVKIKGAYYHLVKDQLQLDTL